MIKYRHFLIYGITFLFTALWLGCDKKEQTVEGVDTEQTQLESNKLTESDIKKIEYTDYALSDTAEKVVNNWAAFQEIQTQIEYLKKADLSFFKDDKAILKSTIDDLKNEIPDRLNETPIEVRLISLETNMYKLEGFAILEKSKKEELISAIKDVLLSHTNLIFQINRKLEKDAQNIVKPQ